MQAAFNEAAEGIIEDLEYEQWIGSYRVDFLVREKKFVIEIDGHEWHKTKEQRTRDCERQRALNIQGYFVIRFTGSEVYRDAKKCVNETKSLLDAHIPKEEIDPTYASKEHCCYRMQEVILSLFSRHDIDFYEDEYYHRFEMGDAFHPLCIEKHGRVISVNHHYISNHDVVYDPIVEFYIQGDAGFDRWIPVYIKQWNDSYSMPVSLIEDDDSNDPGYIILNTEDHLDIANFCEDLGIAIRQQGWIEESKLIEQE